MSIMNQTENLSLLAQKLERKSESHYNKKK